jgi:hypothetical protein
MLTDAAKLNDRTSFVEVTRYHPCVKSSV